ncbi:hypothetical protein ABZ820_20385 [Streptomyces diacarni]|nr:hypothetical protein [Streptomyces diacarni]
MRTVLLAYADEAVARTFARQGLRLAGPALLSANQPALGRRGG